MRPNTNIYPKNVISTLDSTSSVEEISNADPNTINTLF